MEDSTDKKQSFLNNVFPFNLLDQSTSVSLKQGLVYNRFPAGRMLYSTGMIPDFLYLIVSGEVTSSGGGEKKTPQWKFGMGDFCGEEALSEKEYRLSDLTCKTAVEVYKLEKEELKELREKSNLLDRAFRLIYSSFKLRRKKHFSWMGKDEKITLLSRQHVVFLILRMLLTAGTGCAVFGVLLGLAFSPKGFSPWLFTLALVTLVLGLLFAIWSALEWTNDYFAITRDRVLIQRKLFGFFESRQESPFSAILSTGLETSLLGRVIGFGTIHLRSYNGDLRFKRLPSVHLIYELLENQRNQLTREIHDQNHSEMNVLLNERLKGIPGDRTTSTVGKKNFVQSTYYQGGSLLDLLARFFSLRTTMDGGIIYRTHWWILIQKTTFPFLLIFASGLLSFLLLMGFFPNTSATLIYSAAILATLLGFGWWLYRYLDWYNDRYIITQDRLIDVNRKPLGTEDERSAPVKNIQTVEFLRKGIIGLVLNYGTVRIQVGNEELTFDNVYDPASIQAEIFAQFQKNNVKAKRMEQEKMADWIEAYDKFKDFDKKGN